MRKILLILNVLALMSNAAVASERGPGKYNGIILFDRWDACTLYTAGGVMYIPEKLKETVRPYAGKCVVLDASKVNQATDFDGGLLANFKFVGLSGTGPASGHEQAGQVDLHASVKLDDPAHPVFTLVVHNHGAEAIRIPSERVGLAIFTKIPPGAERTGFSSVSADGPSFALGTGYALNGYETAQWKGETGRYKRRVDWSVRAGITPQWLELPAGGQQEFLIDVVPTQGEYDFVFGYGGGPDAAKSAASEMIALDVSSAGTAVAPSVRGR